MIVVTIHMLNHLGLPRTYLRMHAPTIRLWISGNRNRDAKSYKFPIASEVATLVSDFESSNFKLDILIKEHIYYNIYYYSLEMKMVIESRGVQNRTNPIERLQIESTRTETAKNRI